MRLLAMLSAAMLAGGAATMNGPAQAQDAEFDWSGIYGGLFAGFNSADIGVTDIDSLGGGAFAFDDISASGLDGGAVVGYNLLRGNIVYGVELSIAGGGASGSSIVDTVRQDETLEWEVHNSSALSARIGLVRGRTLIYGTVGAARASATFGYLNLDDTGTVVEDDNRDKSTFNGYVLGLGAEHAISSRMTLRAEVLYSDYSDKTLDIVPGLGPIEYDPSSTTLRTGITIHF